LYAFNALHTDYAAGVHQTESARARRRDLMLDGAYAPGRRLTEAEVAESLTMSRTPVREAFRARAADGSVRSAGRGVRVVGLNGAAPRNAFEVRGAPEAPAAELAADPVAPAAPDRLWAQSLHPYSARSPHRPAHVTPQQRELPAVIPEGRAADAASPARRHIDDIRGGAPATAPERT
jgi:hypothetical protein